jgi:hypothetical protein
MYESNVIVRKAIFKIYFSDDKLVTLYKKLKLLPKME